MFPEHRSIRATAGRRINLAFACLAFVICGTACARAQTQPTQAAAGSDHYGGGASAASKPTTPATVAAAPKVGEAAPDFKLPYATQEEIHLKPEEWLALSAQHGKNVILAFYPADWSGGCTKEVCTLRDTFAELAKLNATVLGISGDYVFSHHEWAKFHKLPFALLSDHDHKVARMYGTYNEAAGFNNRSVFLLDKNGVVRYSNPAFKAGDKADYDALRAELEKLK
ncbi:MAG TPA: peroxiredoxin [Pyrinomonadaceae bacterium]|jgi:peroxiredoxin